MLSSLLGEEDNGSLTTTLVDGGWATTVSAGGEETEDHETIFSISFDLTAEGLARYPDVIAVTLAAIELAKQNAESKEAYLSEEQARSSHKSLPGSPWITPLNSTGHYIGYSSITPSRTPPFLSPRSR